jgi:RNA-directed DNA polymerase
MTFPFCKKKIINKPIVHSEGFNQDIKQYSDALTVKDLPVIYSLPHLCLIAGVDIERIIKITQSNRIDSYKRFKLKKKRGGFRVIQTPNDELKYLQRWILKNILEKVPSHDSCKGFDKDTSIKQNADTHLKSEALLKLDLLRFYDSINERRIYGIFKGLGYHPNLAVSLAKLCTITPNEMFISSFRKKENELKEYILSKNEGILAQGSPTSPKLSNLITINLDKRLTGLANKNGLKYSRYADDLTFSGNFKQLQKIKKVIYRVIKEEALFANHSKTKFVKLGGKFLVTGLNVQNDNSTVPRKKKKEIEHHLFHCKDNGVENHLKTAEINNRNFKDWLYGNICFVFSIEEKKGIEYFKAFEEIQWPI